MNTQRVEGHTPKDCPFCGGEVTEDKQGYVGHEKANPFCILGVHRFLYRMPWGEIAENGWNRRASIERLEKVNEALVKYAEQVRDCKYVPDYVHEWSEAVLRLAKEPA